MTKYPTEEQLNEVESFDLIKGDVNDLLSLVGNLWHWPDWGFKRDENHLELHTGGWSGNEEIIYALRSNVIFWHKYWQATFAGGHHYFYISDGIDIGWKPVKI